MNQFAFFKMSSRGISQLEATGGESSALASSAPPAPPATAPLAMSRLIGLVMEVDTYAAELAKRFGAYDAETGNGWTISVTCFATAFAKVQPSVSEEEHARYRAMRDRFQEQVKGGAGGALATKDFDSGELEGLYVKEADKATAMRDHRTRQAAESQAPSK